MTPMGFPGIMKPPRKGLITFSDNMMLLMPYIMQVGIVKTMAMAIETKYAHQGS